MAFYITTAIDYVNGVPHLGHAYEKIAADVIGFWVDDEFIERDAGDLCARLAHHANNLAADHAGATGDNDALACTLIKDIFRQHAIIRR